MRKTFILLATMLALYSCNNGDYDTDPNVNGQTPNNNLTCPILPADSTCSCTDSVSFYSNGVLFTFDSMVTAIKNTDSSVLYVFGHSTNSRWDFSIKNYTGPGVYTINDHEMLMTIDYPDSTVYGASYYLNECGYIKVTVTEENSNFIKGKFYAVVESDTSDGQINYFTVYRTVKGGQFTARWFY